MKFDFLNKKHLFYSVISLSEFICFIFLIVNIIITSRISKQVKQYTPEASVSEAHICAAFPESEVIYRLYECGGKIGIYDAKTDILIDIVDVFVSTLSNSDRIALKKGIEISSFSELAKIIDDFSS